jgi:hypothetical protein
VADPKWDIPRPKRRRSLKSHVFDDMTDQEAIEDIIRIQEKKKKDRMEKLKKERALAKSLV